MTTEISTDIPRSSLTRGDNLVTLQSFILADVHRTLLEGGVFLYPPTSSAPHGKLCLMYEANPMAMRVEQAGGSASTGTQRILEVAPETLHQRVPVFMGNSGEVEHVLSRLS